LFGACNRKIASTTDTKLIIKDSTIYKETICFDTIVIPADTIVTTYTIECDSLTNKPKPINIRSNGKRSSNTIQINSSGVLTSTVNCDELQKIIASKNREIAIYKALAYTKDNHEVKLQWYIPKFYKICFGIALLIISITVIKFIIKWRKIINPLW
jgi:hypothetical protein